MKPLKLNPFQVEAYKNGATMFLFPIDRILWEQNGILSDVTENQRKLYEPSEFIKVFSPLQKGDKFFIQEDFQMIEKGVCSMEVSANKMKVEDARFKDVCLNAELKKVQDLKGDEIKKARVLGEGTHWFRQWINKQNIKYEDNPYVFAITIKGVNKL